jgi:hypothetical protein
MNRTPANDGSWTLRYESLRQHFLGEQRRFETAPLGLFLVIREGLAAWMRAWRQEPPSSSVRSQEAAAFSIPPGWQRELTFLLAHLTSLHLQPTPR